MATLIYLLLFNGLLTAYLTGAGTVLSQLLDRPQNQAWFISCFFLFTLVLLLWGPNLVQKCNAIFICLLAVSLILIISQCVLNYDVNRLSHQNWYFLPGALPIIFCAFAYHNIVPKICQILDFDYKRIKTALILGTAFVFLFNILWIFAVIGALPLEGPGQANLMTAYRNSQPATVPLAKALNSSWMLVIGAFFSLLAITTSYVGCGWALLGFLESAHVAGWLLINPEWKHWVLKIPKIPY